MTDGILEGTVEGDDVSGIIDIGAGGLVEADGVIADAATVLKGTYTFAAGQCTGEQGTFVLQRPGLHPNPIERPGEDGDPGAGQCCKVCAVGKACGDSCISRNFACLQPPGCACNG
jgi:hypothetical protein